MKPLILVTNDDGIDSPGLMAAAEAASRTGEVLIVAPATQQTGMGRAFPRFPEQGMIKEHSLSINNRLVTGYSVNGSPAYTVAHGIMEIASRKPDLCVSGINYGENLGLTLTCSGTLGAVFEADSHDVRGIAISREIDLSGQRTTDFQTLSWDQEIEITTYWIKEVLEKGMPKQASMININIPAGVKCPVQYYLTRQSRQNYFEFIKPERNEWGTPWELKSRRRVYEESLETDSDIYTLYKRKAVSVTPLTWDLSIK